MTKTAILEAAQRIANDVSLQQRLARQSDAQGVAATLAASGLEADWRAELKRTISLADTPPIWERSDAPPEQWLPVQLYHDERGLRLEWHHFAFSPLTEPFFDHSIAKARAHPMNLVLRCSTPLDAVLPLANVGDPDGLIFHVSRCGSTLVGQMLRQLEGSVVIAEAPALDPVIGLHLAGELTRDHVRGLAAALMRDRTGTTRRRFLKLDAWHALALGRICDIFPGVPTVFLFRDPIEVLVSQQRRPGLHVRRRAVDLEGFGLTGSIRIRDEDFPAWVIAAIMRGGLAQAQREGLLLCDYADLPDAFTNRILPQFAIAPTHAELTQMHAVASRHSKDDGILFETDAANKQASAGADLRARADARGLPALYAALSQIAGLTARSPR